MIPTDLNLLGDESYLCGSNPSLNQAIRVSVILNTYNHAESITQCISGILSQINHGTSIELIVVDDGSQDETWSLIESYSHQHKGLKWKLFQFANVGGVACRQFGFQHASHDLCLLLGGDFILTDATILSKLIRALKPNIAFASLYGPHGGMGTLYRRPVVMEVGGFSLDYNRFGSGYRDDSDLYYRLCDYGFNSVFLKSERTAYIHDQPAPKNLWEKCKYAVWRAAIHQLDPLLFKCHRERFTADFKVILGFLVNPYSDYLRATGRWHNGGTLQLSSPQGVILLETDGIFSSIAIHIAGIIYALFLVFFRLLGSIRYHTFLI